MINYMSYNNKNNSYTLAIIYECQTGGYLS